MLDQTQLDAALANLQHTRATEDGIKARIAKRVFVHQPENTTLTLCIIVLDNGFSVVGKSACASPENYHREIGETYAYQDAFRQLWPFFGYAISEGKYQATRHMERAETAAAGFKLPPAQSESISGVNTDPNLKPKPEVQSPTPGQTTAPTPPGTASQ